MQWNRSHLDPLSQLLRFNLAPKNPWDWPTDSCSQSQSDHSPKYESVGICQKSKTWKGIRTISSVGPASQSDLKTTKTTYLWTTSQLSLSSPSFLVLHPMCLFFTSQIPIFPRTIEEICGSWERGPFPPRSSCTSARSVAARSDSARPRHPLQKNHFQELYIWGWVKNLLWNYMEITILGGIPLLQPAILGCSFLLPTTNPPRNNKNYPKWVVLGNVRFINMSFNWSPLEDKDETMVQSAFF